MEPIEIRFAQSTEEVLQGLELYCENFPGGYDENKFITANRSEILSDDHWPSRAIVAVKNRKVVGFFRYCVREMRLGSVNFEALGVVDYCINKSAVREPLYAVKFLKGCLSLLQTLKYPLAIGSGRRIMESYYSRFGFVTASSYAKCWIEKIPLRFAAQEGIRCEVQYSESRTQDYEVVRLATAQNDWGMIYRSKAQWQWIIFQASQMKRFDIVDIFVDDAFAGYFITGKEGVLDFGFKPELHAACASAMLNELQKRHKERGDAMMLPVSFEHQIISDLKGVHFRFEHRCIPDEGIMTVPLNPCALLDTFSQICGVSPAQALSALFGENRSNPRSGELTSDELRILANAMFMGTNPPFFAGNACRNLLPSTWHRMNDLDAL